MPPPYLPADAPILNVLQPLRVNLFPVRRIKPNQVFAHDRERSFVFGYRKNHCSLIRGSIGTSLRSLKPTLFSYGSVFDSIPFSCKSSTARLRASKRSSPCNSGTAGQLIRPVSVRTSTIGRL